MRILLILSLFITFTQAYANVETIAEEETSVEGLVVDKDYLDGWKLTEEEYKRFKHIKENTPRGYYTPENPLIYLGLEAKTKEERNKYAMKVAQLEWENQEKVKSFQLAWQEAVIVLYGQGDIMDIKGAEKFKAHLANLAEQYQGKKNPFNSFKPSKPSKTLYVNNNCDTCESSYQDVYKELLNGKIAKLEIAFNRDLNDMDIRRWASKLGIPLNLNESGLIVLRKQESSEKISNYPSVITTKL